MPLRRLVAATVFAAVLAAAQTAEDYFRRGVRSSQGGDHAQARELFLKALQLQPNSVPVLNNLGVNGLHRGEEAEAERYFRKALSLAPSNVDSLYNLGLIELKRKRLAEAARLLDMAAAPELGESALGTTERAKLQNTLGGIYEELGFYDKAVEAYQSAVRLEPQNEDYAFDLGYEFLIHRNADLAEKIFRGAIARLPGSLRLRLGLTAAYFSRAQYDLVVSELRDAIGRFPESEAGYFFLGRAFVLLSNHEHLFQREWVRDAFEKYRRLKPGDPFPYYLSARTTGREAAVKLLEKALQLDPNFPEAHFELGKIHSDDGRLPEAIQAFEKAAALRPIFPEAHYRLGRAYAKAGDQEKARAASETAAKQQKEIEKAAAEREKDVLRFIYTLK